MTLTREQIDGLRVGIKALVWKACGSPLGIHGENENFVIQSVDDICDLALLGLEAQGKNSTPQEARLPDVKEVARVVPSAADLSVGKQTAPARVEPNAAGQGITSTGDGLCARTDFSPAPAAPDAAPQNTGVGVQRPDAHGDASETVKRPMPPRTKAVEDCLLEATRIFMLQSAKERARQFPEFVGDMSYTLLCHAADLEDELASLPLDWRKDSSLETWFPYTAEEVVRLRAENERLRSRKCKYAEDVGMTEYSCAAVREYEDAASQGTAAGQVKTK